MIWFNKFWNKLKIEFAWIKHQKTMNDLYGDGSDHVGCEVCGFCVDCVDCICVNKRLEN